ncbi:hypothetical protein HAX54_022091 [Datura stramonium]|uniref:Uncharacterized protein n=1 Tax=Datura stramonium TaxID=4076 RepID=A0ABS8UVS3_DATST|nr:hypothetical protein [Datura stramonium]
MVVIRIAWLLRSLDVGQLRWYAWVYIVAPKTTTTETADPVDSDTFKEGSVQSIDSSSECSVDCGYVGRFDGPAVDDGSDVHEEVETFRAERRAYKRRPRSERIPPNPNDVTLGEVELDLGFNETEHQDRCLTGKVGGDESFYCSSNAYSCVTDENDGRERGNFSQKKASKIDPSYKKVV